MILSMVSWIASIAAALIGAAAGFGAAWWQLRHANRTQKLETAQRRLERLNDARALEAAERARVNQEWGATGEYLDVLLHEEFSPQRIEATGGRLLQHDWQLDEFGKVKERLARLAALSPETTPEIIEFMDVLVRYVDSLPRVAAPSGDAPISEVASPAERQALYEAVRERWEAARAARSRGPL